MSDSPSTPPSSDDSLSPNLEAAFADFATVGVPTIMTLLDAIHSEETIELPSEINVLLFGVLGVYSHSLRTNFIQGLPPHLCHQVGVLDVMGDRRVAELITMAMSTKTDGIIEEKTGELDNGEI